jgi:hypothetical protein
VKTHNKRTLTALIKERTGVVVDPAALAPSRPKARQRLLDDLKTRTRPGGVHLVLATQPARAVIPLAAEGLQGHYDGWLVTRRKRVRGGVGFVATKPERQLDTLSNASE